MIKCDKCGRENDDSFSFCLDCGNPLKPGAGAATGAGAAAPKTAQTPAATAPTDTGQPAAKPKPEAKPQPKPEAKPEPKPEAKPQPKPEAKPQPKPGQETAKSSPAQPAASAAAGPAETIPCPKCGAQVAVTDTFCSSCGNRMGDEGGKGSTQFMHVASPEAAAQKKARMVLIKPDGSEGTVFTLAADKTALGRSQGTIMFPKDQYVSPRHAELTLKGGKLTITDLDSLNGVYFKIKGETPIHPGTYFRIGRQLLRLEVPGEFQPIELEKKEDDNSTFWGSPPPQVWARLVQVLEGGKIGEIHLLTRAEAMMGREEGEIRFPEDGFISSKHCLLINRDGDCALRDLGSSNGTYLRIRESQVLENEDRVQIGNQVLKVDIS